MMQEQPQAGLMGPSSEAGSDEQGQQFLNQLVAEAVEYIHGRARKQVVEQLKSSTNTPETVGAITYKLTRGLLEKHKKAGMAMDIEMDTAMGLATEVIDMQMEILEKVAPEKLGDPQKTREDALLRTMMLHSEQLKDDPNAQEDAKQMMRGMIQDGTVDQAFQYVNQRAAQEGVSVNDMISTGNEWAKGMVGGGQKPVAGAVQQGLMSRPPQ